jgi:hypothetical protein
VRPQIRIGLNTGAAAVGKVDDSGEAGDAVLGDTVNFAARLQALAEPDTVFMSEAAYRLAQGMIDASFAGEYAVKGKSKPTSLRASGSNPRACRRDLIDTISNTATFLLRLLAAGYGTSRHDGRRFQSTLKGNSGLRVSELCLGR